MKVLLVERDRKDCDALIEWLAALGASAHIAQNIEEMRAQSARLHPELIVLGAAFLDGRVETFLEGLRQACSPVVLRVRHGFSTLVDVWNGSPVSNFDVVTAEQPRRVIGIAGMIGRSAPMMALFARLFRVASTDAPVFVFGETGTGKELVARALHAIGPRAGRPFVPVNCGAVPAGLFESELFGHERGSYTGACRKHRGFCEQADGGTLFLDEVTEMPLDLQVKLLRVLENRELNRVGGESSIPFNARIVAASNKAPKQALKEGSLREDLYYRLFVFPIEVPALRDRGTDVELLADLFLAALNSRQGTQKQFTETSRLALRRYDWPGNVRELRNTIEQAYINADHSDQVVAEMRAAQPRAHPLDIKVGMSIRDVERMLIEATLEHVAGDKQQAAKILGISLKTLYNRLNLYRGQVDAKISRPDSNASLREPGERSRRSRIRVPRPDDGAVSWRTASRF